MSAPNDCGAQSARSATASDAALGRKIRGLRRARGITLAQLAATVGVTGTQMHRYEVGTTRIAASRLVTIANALGVRADRLIGSCTAQPEPAKLEADAPDLLAAGKAVVAAWVSGDLAAAVRSLAAAIAKVDGPR